MTKLREQILQQINRLKVGQAYRIEPYDMELFEPHPLDRYADNAKEVLLNNLIGSAYGAFTVEIDPIKHHATVTRHEPGERIVYVEKDRRHLFDVTPDGHFERNDVPFIK